MNIEDIKSILPHRPPMLMIDSIDEIQELEHAHGYKAVSINEPYFVGHFPDYAVLPGVFIIEACAQISSVMILIADIYRGKMTYYTRLSKSKFLREVRPGEILELSSKVLTHNENIIMCSVSAKVAGEDVFTGEISLMVVDVFKKGRVS